MNVDNQQNTARPQPLINHNMGPDNTDPIQQLRYLWRYKWQVVIFIIVAVIAGTLLAYSLTPKYRGTVTLLLEPKGVNVVKIDEVYEGDNPTDEYRKTQHEVLRSRKLAERVVGILDLEQYPEFVEKEPGLISRLEGWVLKAIAIAQKYGVPIGQPINAEAASKTDYQVVDEFMDRVDIEPILSSHLVKVHVEAENPELSALLANSLARTYIQGEIDSRMGITEQASGWLTTRLTELKAELEASERELQKFYESQQLVNMGGARGLLEDELLDNSRRLREARKTKTELENVYRKVMDANGDLELMQEIPGIQQDQLVQSTKRSYLEAAEAVSQLQSRYGKKHPKMIAAQARLIETKEAYFKQLRLATDGVKSKYEIARNTVASLAGIVDGSKGQIQKLDRKQHQLELLQREVETNRDLFDTFLTRFKETDISGNLETSNVRIVDKAVVPNEPYKPRKKLWIGAAAILGFFLGSLLALLRGFLDDRVLDSSDLERVTGLPVITVLPIVKGLVGKAKNMARVEIDAPNSVFAEGVRTIRTALQIADSNQKNKTIMITSSVPSEGKTSIAENLAAAFGQMENVLLIEGDLRKPSFANYLDLPDELCGVEEALRGEKPIQDCIHTIEYSSVDVLPCINAPHNPSELLGSTAFASLLDAVGKRYDRIIIDSPPCQAVSDALIIGRLVSSVLFVAKADATHSRLIANSLKQLRHAELPVLGAILNQADMKKRGKYGAGYYYYQDYYQSSKPA